MRLSYDKESGAFTIYSREGKPDHAEDSSNEDFSKKPTFAWTWMPRAGY